jgi:mannose-1-phosphate guanylyltransferase
MNKNFFVVLMAGGVGVRFWPYSRNSKPKQFLDVLGIGKSLLQSTYERFLPICASENIYVVTHEEHAHLVKEQLPQLGDDQILAEPMRKNTAACIAYASYKIAQRSQEAVVVVSPSDHLILKEADFHELINRAGKEAESQNKLITIGITPTRPETGYGYIQFLTEDSFLKKVKTFTEKPQLELARKFLDSGDFVWNSGIFIWGIQAILNAMHKFLPELTEFFEDAFARIETEGERQAILTAYSQCKNISIDYGIMEKADNVFMCPGDFSWSDLGSWGSIHEISTKDANNNVVNANALLYNVNNCIIKGSPDRLIVAQGLNGYLVGEFGNVVIVCEKDREDQFRKFVNDVKTKPNGSDFT